jgi:hypothetical protein
VSDEQRRTEQARIREQVRELLEPAARIQEAFSPLLKDISNFIDQNREQILAFTAGIARFQKQAVISLQPYLPALEAWAKATAKSKRLREAGFLPHSTTLPFADDETLEVAALSAAIETHYRTNWPEIAKVFSDTIETYAVDDEAKDTFREALAAHANGHYRSVCRVLFPEFERITRYDLHSGQLKGLASQRPFRVLVNDLGASYIRKLGGLNLYELLEVLLDHLYVRVEEMAAVERFRGDPIPNRK